jgi:hypothetical protein
MSGPFKIFGKDVVGAEEDLAFIDCATRSDICVL